MEIQWTSFHWQLGHLLPRQATRTDFSQQRMLCDRLLQAFTRHGGQHDDSRFWLQALLKAVAEDHDLEPPSLERSHDRIKQLIQEIDAHPEHCWSIGELAARCSLSTSYFRRIFRELTKMSPQAYVIDARMRRAQALLRQTDAAIGTIAADLGYQDIYHFSKQYRHFWGWPPNQERRR